jgi:fucose permease
MHDEIYANTGFASVRKQFPTAAFMHCAFFVTGMGVLMLGPVLPLFSSIWHLGDARSGMLFAAQFLGSFVGAAGLRRNLHKSLLAGCFALPVGFGLLAFAAGVPSGFWLAIIALLIGGFGLGQVINSINLIAGSRYRQRRGAALTLLNLSWSLGALFSPLVIGHFASRISVSELLWGFVGTVAALGFSLLLQFPGGGPNIAPEQPENGFVQNSATRKDLSALLVYFGILFFLYGGLENSISGWLATFSLRYAGASLNTGGYITASLLVGITAGRAFASAILLRLSDRVVQIGGLALTVIATAIMPFVHTPSLLVAETVFLGFSLAPFIAVTSSLLISNHPSPRQAGTVMATAALGGAAIPWLVGIVSQQVASLKLALEVPLVISVALIGLAGPPMRSVKS